MKEDKIYIANGLDWKEMTKKVLEAAKVADRIPSPSALVGVKPNLVAAKTPESGATTHPQILAGVFEYLSEHGFENVICLEGSWVGDATMRAARVAGILQVCEEYGIPFTDLQKDKGVPKDARGLAVEYCQKALELDYLFNCCVVKGHCQTYVTCALKNHKGLITNAEKRRFHARGLMVPIGHVAAPFYRREFCLADNICGDPDFEEGGNPIVMNRILGCYDPVKMDAFACSVLGYETSDVPYIGIAEELGFGTTRIGEEDLVMLNEPVPEERVRRSDVVRRLEKYVCPDSACSACYGALMHALKRMDDEGTLPAGSFPKLCIGQGYREKTGAVGIGRCTCGFERSLKGCPPSGDAVRRFLEENWV